MGQGQRIVHALSSVRTGAPAALLAWLALLSAVAGAHTGGLTGYADIHVQGMTVRYTLTLSQLPSPADALVVAGPSGPDLSRLVEGVASKVTIRSGASPCPAVGAQAAPPRPDRMSATLGVVYKCREPPHQLVVRDDSFDLLGDDLHTLAKITWPGGQQTHAFATEQREARFAITNDAGGVPDTGSSFFLLGVAHILGGYDHLLFLAALLVRVQSWHAVLKVITAFTVAHSLTLALAVLGVVALPDRLVEAAIALSIAWVAASNLVARRNDTDPWIVTFLFGLVHGLGFSGVLREMHLPRDGLAWLLLQFNVGVEVGQALAAAVALGVLAWLRVRRWRERALRGASTGILVAGLLLLAGRARACDPPRVGSDRHGPEHQQSRATSKASPTDALPTIAPTFVPTLPPHPLSAARFEAAPDAGAPTMSQHPSTHPAPLDGRTFHGIVLEAGRTEGDADTLVFADGRFRSSACDRYGYGDGAYRAHAEGDRICFDAETESPRYGRLRWRGTISGGRLDGTLTMVRDGTPVGEKWVLAGER